MSTVSSNLIHSLCNLPRSSVQVLTLVRLDCVRWLYSMVTVARLTPTQADWLWLEHALANIDYL